MIHIENESNCCGCGLCSVVCPCDCISMQKGTLGHLFPKIDSSKCVDCGLCNQKCPMTNITKLPSFRQKLFAAYALDKDVRFRGSSGGMFELFSNNLLGAGYQIYGAAFDSCLQLKCTCATNKDELIPLLKSKYIQCDLTHKYVEIEKKLKEGKSVLFVSTPCQVAALKNYLSKEYQNLTTIDFLCHGVPSQTFFDECAKFDFAQNEKNCLDSYMFRAKKEKGSTPHYFSYKLHGEKKERIKYYFDSTYYAAFQQYVSLRESCYACPFFGNERSSDITIGDFHEIDKYIRGINRFEGVSKVIINTKKGERLWEDCRKSTWNEEVDIQKLINDGALFSRCTDRPKHRDDFVNLYKSNGVKGVWKKYLNPVFYIRNRVYYSLPKFARRIMK